MTSQSRFRFTASVVAIVFVIYAGATIVAEALSPKRPAFPNDPTHIVATSLVPVDAWPATISPFRGDVQASYAMTLALQALRSGHASTLAKDKEITNSAQVAARKALALTPSDSQLWLALALLMTRADPSDTGIREALKMSYFTAPNDAALIPVRLDTATVFDAIADADLAELARGDVRLILTKRPDLRSAITTAYRRASPDGRAFLEQAVGSIDARFRSTLGN